MSCRGAACSFCRSIPVSQAPAQGEYRHTSNPVVTESWRLLTSGSTASGSIDIAEVVSVAQAPMMPIRWAVGCLSCAVGV